MADKSYNFLLAAASAKSSVFQRYDQNYEFCIIQPPNGPCAGPSPFYTPCRYVIHSFHLLLMLIPVPECSI